MPKRGGGGAHARGGALGRGVKCALASPLAASAAAAMALLHSHRLLTVPRFAAAARAR